MSTTSIDTDLRELLPQCGNHFAMTGHGCRPSSPRGHTENRDDGDVAAPPAPPSSRSPACPPRPDLPGPRSLLAQARGGGRCGRNRAPPSQDRESPRRLGPGFQGVGVESGVGVVRASCGRAASPSATTSAPTPTSSSTRPSSPAAARSCAPCPATRAAPTGPPGTAPWRSGRRRRRIRRLRPDVAAVAGRQYDQAAHHPTLTDAALRYADLGIPIFPLPGSRSAGTAGCDRPDPVGPRPWLRRS